MKKSSFENFISHLTEQNFLNLYQVRNFDTDKCESICFLDRDDALAHLQYLSKSNQLNSGRYYIAETCVYMG